jgi:hypothetical protein
MSIWHLSGSELWVNCPREELGLADLEGPADQQEGALLGNLVSRRLIGGVDPIESDY